MSENQFPPPDEPVSPSDQTVANTGGAAWPPARPAFQRQEASPFPRGITILIIILALLLVGSGLGFILYTTTAEYRTTLGNQATSVALATVGAHNTAQARQQATANVFATANSHIYATATAQARTSATIARKTANATATDTAYNNLLSQVTGGATVLSDPLTDNSANNKWDVTTGTTKGACVFISMVYHAIEPQQGYYQPCIARATDFSNFAYQIHMVITSGDQSGIIFRFNSTNASFYLFRVGVNGSYALDLYKNRVLAATLLTGLSGAISAGITQGNDLGVIASGDVLSLYVNQHFIGSVTNSYLSSGAIGVIALDYRNFNDTEFSNAQVWNVAATH